MLDLAAVTAAGDDHDRQVAHAFRRQPLQQRRRRAHIPEPADQHGRAILDPGHRVCHRGDELVDHLAAAPPSRLRA
jgi:hypothetical protein